MPTYSFPYRTLWDTRGILSGLRSLNTPFSSTAPSLDYCVAKVPRWDLSKFENVLTDVLQPREPELLDRRQVMAASRVYCRNATDGGGVRLMTISTGFDGSSTLWLVLV
ncbi:hypothetical protein H257_18198 [Aphanomyces astaci]|uniref:Uncharacterized protein n=1 Tax=Aphanomyces astaci TaxID=112090 RepID=W4FBZ2_APHAT|nr:hypothetical protein H257_18198 [Aphanomyces astaci]ETV64990.1 hypothetical protein H257_18198 [Aphanomyces astaci]|eukprot:XP_009845515.1 hypothetical protein H257_18198 [Aphanomyces astaci]